MGDKKDEYPGPLTVDEIKRRYEIIKGRPFEGTPGANMSGGTVQTAPPPLGPEFGPPTDPLAESKRAYDELRKKEGRAPYRPSEKPSMDIPDPDGSLARSRAQYEALKAGKTNKGGLIAVVPPQEPEPQGPTIGPPTVDQAFKSEGNTVTGGVAAPGRRVPTTTRNSDAEDRERLADATFADDGGGATGAPAMVSPGGRTPHSWTTQTQEGVKLSPDTKAYAEGAEASKADAAGQHLEADERAAAGELSILRRHELVQQARETELRDRAEQQRRRFEGSQARLEAMTAAVEGDHIDPDQWFKTRSAGQLFATGLSVALGAVGQAFRGGRGGNVGLEMMNDGIREEIEAQKANAQLRRHKLEDQRSLLGQMAKTFGDERVAEDAAWILYLERAKTQLAAQQAASKSDFAKARYADAITQIKEEIAGRREKWDQLEQDRVTRVQHDVNAPPTYAGAAGGPIDKGDREDIRETAKELVKAGVPQQLATLQQIDRTIDTFGNGDIPGVGPIKSHIPDVAYGLVGDDRAVAARQAFQGLKLQVQHEIAGASLTSGEKAELDVLTKGAYDAKSLRRVVDVFRAKLSGTAKTIGTIGSDRARAEMTRRAKAIEGERGAPYNVPRSTPAAPYVREPK